MVQASTSPFKGVTRTFQQASDDLTLKSGWTMVVYVMNPDSVALNDVGITVGITAFTSNAQYYKETNIEAAQQQPSSFFYDRFLNSRFSLGNPLLASRLFLHAVIVLGGVPLHPLRSYIQFLARLEVLFFQPALFLLHLHYC